MANTPLLFYCFIAFNFSDVSINTKSTDFVGFNLFVPKIKTESLKLTYKIVVIWK